MLKLVIGNKNYSSWSMRPWVLLRQADIEFEEVKVRFDSFAPDSAFKRALARLKVAGKVPVLLDGDLAIWDTLSIAEYLAESFPEKHLWPTDRKARARARSLCAELHPIAHLWPAGVRHGGSLRATRAGPAGCASLDHRGPGRAGLPGL